jgi:hypothetical protein
MSAPLTLSRRGFFGLAAGGALSGQMQVGFEPAMAIGPVPDGTGGGMRLRSAGPTLEVAGPRDSDLGAWARVLAAPLAAGLHGRFTLNVHYRGGADGVTAANQFDARAMPDGQTALLFSGSVMLAWLVGEPRVRLDPAHVLPLMAAFGPGVLMVQGGLDGTGHGARPVRLAMGPQPDAALTALLGLDLLGIPALAVPDGGDPLATTGKSAANAVFLHGPEAASRAAPLLLAGFRPVLSTAPGLRDQPGLPGLQAPFFLSGLAEERAARDPLVAAWHAMAAATSLCAVLVVPRLTPAAAIAHWRQGVSAALREGAVTARAASQAMRLAAGEAVSSGLAPMQEDDSVQLALRRWLAARLDWQAG